MSTQTKPGSVLDMFRSLSIVKWFMGVKQEDANLENTVDEIIRDDDAVNESMRESLWKSLPDPEDDNESFSDEDDTCDYGTLPPLIPFEQEQVESPVEEETREVESSEPADLPEPSESNVEEILNVSTEPVVQEDNTVEPVVQEDNTVEPLVKEDNAVEPLVQEDNTVEPVVQEDNTVEPVVQEDNTVEPVVDVSLCQVEEKPVSNDSITDLDELLKSIVDECLATVEPPLVEEKNVQSLQVPYISSADDLV
jgi:hypothetical protein